MAVLYSDESRKLLLEKSKTWNKKIEVLNTIEYILRHKYLRTDKIHDDYAYFDTIRPEYILRELYNYNRQKFVINPDSEGQEGYKSALYIRKIYKLLGVSVLFLDYVDTSKELYYSLYNNAKPLYDPPIKNGALQLNYKYKSIETINRKAKNPDVIIVNINNNNEFIRRYPECYKLDSDKYKGILDNLNNGEDDILYEENVYINDSILLANHNTSIGGHSIAGISCKGDRYVYNGWTRTTIDKNIKNQWVKIDYNDIIAYYNEATDEMLFSEKELPEDAIIVSHANESGIPCELMKFEWNPNKDLDFCLNRNKCILDTMDIDMDNLCFSFNKGSRELIFIKKHKTSKLDVNKDKKCSKGEVENPLSGKCVSLKIINKIPENILSRPEKICPEGKVINPKTGRCINMKSMRKLFKEVSPSKRELPTKCPEGKMINPKTGRCINIKTANKKLKKESPYKRVSHRKCPEGKMINPKTGRCINIKVKK
jgi:hypothetical protein